MHSFRQLMARRFSRRRRYDDLSVSIQEHIEERTDELMDEGMSAEAAALAARREFGNVTLIQERSREAWQWRALESLLADLKYTFRRLRKSPAFAATVLLTLAIGIGANTAVFSVVNCVLIKPLPYPKSNRLVSLRLEAPGAGGLSGFANGLLLSTSMDLTFSAHNHSFQSMGIWAARLANITGIARPEEVRTALVSDGVLQTLDVPPVLGRWFSRADQQPHGAKTVILSYGYWQRQFGGNRSVIGRTVEVDSQPREIIGVMPRSFHMVTWKFDLLIPMALDPASQKLAGFGYNGIARLRPGVSIAQANADIARLIPVWMDSWTNGPGSNPHYYKIWRIAPDFRPLKQLVIGSVSNVLWLVMATVGLVMLIACTNIANLLLVRAESRHLELSIRAALGAGRKRIARELLLESVALGLMGGTLAIGVAYGGLRLLTALGPANLPRIGEISLDGWSLLFALVLSIVSGLFFGSIPALKYARTAPSILVGGASRTSSTSRSRQRSRNILVIAQVAMALVLMVCALLMIRTFAALRNVDPGFSNAAHIQTVRITIPKQLIANEQMVTRTQNDIRDKIADIPGVSSVSFAASVPMDNDDPDWDQIAVEGKQYEGTPPLELYNYIAPGYFHTMGTRLVAGRDYTWDDLYNLHPYVIVSDNFAREYWGSAAAAIGKRIREFDHQPWQQVIGVVQDVRQHGVDQKAPAIIYWPAMLTDAYASQPTVKAWRWVAFVIRSSRAGNQDFINQVQQAVWSVNSSLPVASIQTMQEIYSQSLERTSFTLVMLAIAGSMALLLSIIGIYGVVSYAVSQRTREIGIRLALGAQKNELRWLFVRSALMLTVIGAAIGACAAAVLTQWMKSLLFGINPLDPLTFMSVPVILAATAVVASYLPARRAASVNPVEALRAE